MWDSSTFMRLLLVVPFNSAILHSPKYPQRISASAQTAMPFHADFSLSFLSSSSIQSPPKGATIPYRPKPASTPLIFSGGQVRSSCCSLPRQLAGSASAKTGLIREEENNTRLSGGRLALCSLLFTQTTSDRGVTPPPSPRPPWATAARPYEGVTLWGSL